MKQRPLNAIEISHLYMNVLTNTIGSKLCIAFAQTSPSEDVQETFSDRLLMYHISLISASGIGNYATAAAASQRSDLMINYERLSLEISRLAKSGDDIMIKHEWLEQPPRIKDRNKLARNKQKG